MWRNTSKITLGYFMARYIHFASQYVPGLVSVVIPAYNAGNFIEYSLKSIVSQKYRPIEVIIVDDGSNDLTAHIVESFAQKHQDMFITFHLARQENGGPSRARNSGISAARGEWITFLDADDQWTSDKLTKQVDYHLGHPEISFSFADMRVVKDSGVTIESVFVKYGYHPCDVNGVVDDPFKKLLMGNFIPTGTVMLRRDCFEEVAPFDESIRHGEDYDLWLRMALKFRFGCLPEVLKIKKDHAANLSQQEHKFYQSKIYILRKISRMYGAELKLLGVSLEDVIFLTMREFAYYYYVKRQYLASLGKALVYIVARTGLLRVD